MTVAEFKPLENVSEGGDLYEALVESFEFIDAENSAQRHLVTPGEWEQWEKVRASFESKLLSIGEAFAQDKVWRAEDMESMKTAFLGATRRTLEELQVAQAKQSREREVSRVRSLMERIRNGR